MLRRISLGRRMLAVVTCLVLGCGSDSTPTSSTAPPSPSVTLVPGRPYLVKDIVAGLEGSNPLFLTDVDGALFFVAYDGVHG